MPLGWQNEVLYGIKKDQAYIWSSVTLYDPETAAQRKKWLNDFLTENSQPTQEQILGFHQFSIGDPNNDCANCSRRPLFYCKV